MNIWVKLPSFCVTSVALLIGCLAGLIGTVQGQTPQFEVAGQLWQDSLGNHRLVVDVPFTSHAVEVKVDWRRRDKDAANKVVIITDSTGRQINNIKINHLDRETGDFVFDPVSGSGIYYVYYMPWSGHKWEGGFQGDYLHHQPKADDAWLKKLAGLTAKRRLPLAHNVVIQARTAFDSFYPMEIVAKKREVEALVAKYKDPFLLFFEDRKHPIKMFDDLPLRWIQKGPARAGNNHFSVEADRNEYYVFQIGVFASTDSLSDIQVSYKNAPFKITCFNTQGVDSKGKDFVKKVHVPKGHVQPLWLGVDIPKEAHPGKYTFTVEVKDAAGAARFVNVQLNVRGKLLADRGDKDLWRLSRLRWLNSRLGIDDHNTAESRPLLVDKSTATIKAGTGTVQLNALGLPKDIIIGGENLLSGPIDLSMQGIEKQGKLVVVPGQKLHFTHQASGKVAWETAYENSGFGVSYQGQMESDGYLRYKVIIRARKDAAMDDISLQIPVNKQLATYFMGMGSGKPFGMNGGYTPFSYDWKWRGPQNSFWLGTYNAGIYCKFLGATYNGPMLNLYHPAPPPSWYNNNNGGFKIRTYNNLVSTSTYTGKELFKKDSVLTLEFSLLLTPVQKLNTSAQFANRYYQNYGNPYPGQKDIEAGVNVINVHHANRINPYINYPFVMVDSMRAFVDHFHKLGIKTKIYYTIRELSNQCAEIWALRSLGTEIFSDGSGGGYPWLREHLVSHYDVQWFTPIDGYEACDAAIKTSGDSRWYNYYVEGLRWLVKNVGIDGLYLDDVAYDRDMLKRMRKVMDMVKPGCMIDLHSNTDFSKGPATQYTEFFPYINKLWFGENFHYEKMQPDNWLVETSGIPFGLMGDMLFSGGNPWRGMVYGMTNRDGWPTDGKLCNPKPIWEELDHFGIKNASMYGYWEKNPAVTTDNDKVLATAYRNGHKLLIALASWDTAATTVHLKLNWEKLVISAEQISFVARDIKDFQPGKAFKGTGAIEVKPGKGWLLEVQ